MGAGEREAGSYFLIRKKPIATIIITTEQPMMEKITTLLKGMTGAKVETAVVVGGAAVVTGGGVLGAGGVVGEGLAVFSGALTTK